MDRLRRSFRESFRRRKEHMPESSKPHQWQADEAAVRAGTCSFQVKYLGCVEVFESRGMQTCEEAFKVLKNSRRKPIRSILYVSGDALRVVDEESKMRYESELAQGKTPTGGQGLLVDQTIEKVSFCAPDRNYDRGFSYICRDGTTRRWMCHGFMALKESGERLSHAVGCAFAACLERKQKRDKDCTVNVQYDANKTSFTRFGSFRQSTLTDRMMDPQQCKPAGPVPESKAKVDQGAARSRPVASADMYMRQASFRGLATLNESSPFKRQMSLRMDELPSTLQRQQALFDSPSHNGGSASPITEEEAQLSPAHEDSISNMCQQLTQGLSALTYSSDTTETNTTTSTTTGTTTQHAPVTTSHDQSLQLGSQQKTFDPFGTSNNRDPFGMSSDVTSVTTGGVSGGKVAGSTQQNNNWFASASGATSSQQPSWPDSAAFQQSASSHTTSHGSSHSTPQWTPKRSTNPFVTSSASQSGVGPGGVTTATTTTSQAFRV